jgi:hypothetical protein
MRGIMLRRSSESLASRALLTSPRAASRATSGKWAKATNGPKPVADAAPAMLRTRRL